MLSPLRGCEKIEFLIIIFFFIKLPERTYILPVSAKGAEVVLDANMFLNSL